jgi:hypothetical protein
MAGFGSLARESRKQKEKQDRKSKRSRRVAERYAQAEQEFWSKESERKDRSDRKV